MSKPHVTHTRDRKPWIETSVTERDVTDAVVRILRSGRKPEIEIVVVAIAAFDDRLKRVLKAGRKDTTD